MSISTGPRPLNSGRNGTTEELGKGNRAGGSYEDMITVEQPP